MKKISKVLAVAATILVGTSSIPFPQIGIEKTEASTAIVNIKTNYQTTANLTLRQSASTSSKALVVIPKGKVLTATQRQGTWYKVSYTYSSGSVKVTKTGWVSGSYLKEYYKYTTTSTTYYFTKVTSKLYSTPDTKKKEVYTITGNNGFTSTQAVVNSAGQTWYRISYKGKYYYIFSGNVIKNSFTSLATTKYKATRDTYVYQSYGTVFTKLIKIPKNTVVSTNKRIGNWYNVSYNGKTGYMNISDFTKFVEVKYESTSTAYYFTNVTANLYASPDTSTPVVATVASNNGFASTQKATDLAGKLWYRVSYNGQNLYVKSADVSAKSFTTFTQTNYKATKDSIVYKSYGNAFTQLATIPKDTVIVVNKKIGNWYSVSYDGVAGYVSISDYIKNDTVTVTDIPDTTYINTTELNLRQTYDADSALLIVIPVSKLLVVTEKSSNNWYKVSYLGRTGFVSGSYIKQVKSGDPITSRDSYQFIDLRTQSPVTAQQINNYIANYVNVNGKKSVLTGQGQLFIDAGNQYGVNALYLAAHAIHESGFGTSNISLGKSNLFGFGSYDASPFVASFRFLSVKENINYIAREMKSTYLNPANWKYKGAYLGFSTKDMNGTRIDANSEGMNFYYASDYNWGKAIASHMQKILPFNKAYYDTAKVNTSIPGRPSTPVGSDIFPTNIEAIAKNSLKLYTNKGDSTVAKTIAANTKFILLEKANDYWVRLKVDGKEYWTNSIKFDVYGQYISVTNLGRVTADDTNIRSTSTSAADNVIGKLKLNEYVSFVKQADGTIAKDNTKQWCNIQLADGTSGWISASLVTQELK